jgi:molybdopterin converting factor small subunit
VKVDVLIFGAAASDAGSDRVAVTVGDRPTVREVLAALHVQHPVIRGALPPPESGRLAVNHAFASGDHEIGHGDEVALVTLLGGG